MAGRKKPRQARFETAPWCVGALRSAHRGEEHLPLNPTLQEAQEMGMEIHYLDRTTYRQKHTTEVIKGLTERFGKFAKYKNRWKN